MKVLVYVKKEDVISGNITEYHTHRPQPGYEKYIQISISQDEFVQLDDRKSGKWYKEQYNRNRSMKDQIK
tara:strand:+ start:346 stop:555 length:210 start_codon:yes stop_codon:yes gene_type:complete